MQVERVMIDELDCDPANVRAHDSKNLDAIKSSLRRFGQQKPIVVNEKGIVIAGNGTLTAARALGWDSINIVKTVLEGSEATAYAIADNRTGELAEWDEEALAKQLSALQIEDEALVEAAGFSDAELTALVDEVTGITEGNTDPDEVPEVPEEPMVQPGQIWQLGNHRLMCGDSTSAEDVAALMDGEKADVCVTDPPYSVNYVRSQEQRGGNAAVHSSYNEADIDPSDLLKFMALVPCDVMIWSYPVDRHFQNLARAYQSHGWEFKKELVWVKDSFSFWMSAKYQQKHEPIMLAVRKGAAIGGNVPSNATTVFEYPRPKSHELHPTAKPIDLWITFIENHAPLNGISYEPFCGSGTSIIACEQTGRKCYGMELSPAYCDVIIKRWEDFTGQTAELVNG